MKVTVRGISGSYHTLELAGGTDVSLLRQRLEDLEGVGAENISLVYAGQELQDGYPLSQYSLHAYNLAGEPVIYMQVSVPERVPIFLASHANPRKRIAEYVEPYTALSHVVDLLHDHRLTGGIDPETCLFVAKRTTGTTVIGADFTAESTVSSVQSRIESLEGRRISHLTFTPAHDGNVHIVADHCAEPAEQTIMHPRRTFVPVAHTKAERKEGHVTMEDMKKELCVNEYPHPPHPVLYTR